MSENDNITLLGFMGTGKSSTGRCLAAVLAREFVDMDAVIEEREGCAISRIFRERGEASFRELERGLVAELCDRRGLVIAAGGGVALDPENLCRLAAAGPVICLTAEPDTILRRVAGSDRPLLAAADPRARIAELLERRRACYAAIPWQLRTDGLSPEQVARRIMDLLPAAQ